MSTEVLIGLGTMGVIFLLVMFLGIQIQINALSVRIDDLIQLTEKDRA